MYCTECKEPCKTHIEDFGYGSGEAHGVKYNHINKKEVSNCCDADITEEIPEENYHE